MSDHKKLRVGVVFGGRSGEHEVSIRSARSVLAALDTDKYDVIPIGITKDGRWMAGAAEPEQLTAGDAQPVLLPPTPGRRALQTADGGTGVEEQQWALDVVVPVLHGTYGEDGTVQGLLELADMPYVGAGVLGSAVGMDKAIFKRVMEAHGLPVLPWELVRSSDVAIAPHRIVSKLEHRLLYPLFVKPANLGSSVGISKCNNRAELLVGLAQAAEFDRRIVVEQGADVRELEVAVLGNEDPRASVVGEVRPEREFYDYEAKYVTDDSELLIPAPLDEATADKVRALAIQAYEAIDCAGLGRVDLMLDRKDGRLYINEINTMPGFTSISMYPKLWSATDLPYAELLDKLIQLALERHEVKTNLRTEYARDAQTNGEQL